MKLNRLETHDRLLHFQADQALNVFQGATDCMLKNPLSLALQEKSPYIYLFAHPRTAEDGVNKVMYWQPRLSKPEAQTNSYLFRAKSKTDQIQVCWLIPPKEMWDEYKKGNVTQNDLVMWSVNQFILNKKGLEMPDLEDMTEANGRAILKKVIEEHLQGLKNAKPKILGASPPSSQSLE